MARGPLIRDIDRGMKRVVREFRTAAGKEAAAGYPVGSTSGAMQDGVPIWLFMTYNEEGVPDPTGTAFHSPWLIPPRPFMRQAWVQNLPKYLQMRDQGLRSMVTGSDTMANILTRIALEMHNDIKRSLLSGAFEDNAPSTVERKGSSLPLFDTGAATNAVTFEVRSKQ